MTQNKTLAEILEELDERLRKSQKELEQYNTTYIQLTETELRDYEKIKVIIDQRKPTQTEIIQAYIINSIRKEEPDEYIQEIARAYKQDLNKLKDHTILKFKKR